MQTRKLALLASLLLGLAVAGAVWKARKTDSTPLATAANCQTVKLLTGSAKLAYLQDARVVAELGKQGLCLTLSKSGSFAEDSKRLAEFDAVWPAGANAAADFAGVIKQGGDGAASYPVFATALALASWKPLLPVFERNGLLEAKEGANWFLLDKALSLMLAGKRWNELHGNDVYPINKGLLVNTPDIRKSNTGLLYIALLAWMRQHNEVPVNEEAARREALALAPLISRQGFQEGTLAGPFEDYIGQGMGKAPLVLIYEAQFAEAQRQGKLREKHTLLYPRPGLMLKHVLVARSVGGKRLGEQLANNAVLQGIAAQYGFRTNNDKLFETAMAELKLPAPELLELGEIPGTQLLDAMQASIAEQLH